MEMICTGGPCNGRRVTLSEDTQEVVMRVRGEKSQEARYTVKQGLDGLRLSYEPKDFVEDP